MQKYIHFDAKYPYFSDICLFLYKSVTKVTLFSGYFC